jgi:hypothetical protein
MELMLVTVGKARTYKDTVEQVASSPAVAAPASGAATGAENPLAFLRYRPPPPWQRINKTARKKKVY